MSVDHLPAVAHNCHDKSKRLTAKSKDSRQKEKDSRQKEKDSRQKEKVSRQKEKSHGKKKKTQGKKKRLKEKRKDSRKKEKTHGKKKRPGPGPLAPESSALTMRPPCLPPSVPNLKNILMSKWHLIETQPLLRKMYKHPPLLSNRKGRLLKSVLVRAKLEGQSFPIVSYRSRIWPVNYLYRH